MAKQLKDVAKIKADPKPDTPPDPKGKIPNNKKSGLPMLPQYKKPKPPR